MEEFLRASKKALEGLENFRKIKVVMGNESCDLDSAVCALVHGFWHFDKLKTEHVDDVAVIPLLNVTKRMFKIKTEVVYVMKENNIPLELLTFRDEIDLRELSERQMLELSLVDHHTLTDYDVSLAGSVVEVIDHRPQDTNWPWTGRDINLEKVGSCATLVARNILDKNPRLVDQQISSLLKGNYLSRPILIDTSNFSESVARATQLDIQVMQELEKISTNTEPGGGSSGSTGCGDSSGKSTPLETQTNRNKIYSAILNAKTDISCLSPEDLILKDLKFVNGIPIPGLPILVEEFLNLNAALEALNSFTRERESQHQHRLTVILGMNLKGQVVKRDLGVFSFLPNDLENKIVKALESVDSGLDLSPSLSTSKENWSLKLYKQGNVRATRKQILPIIQSASAGC
ncbi:Similar to Prune1: Exopolyphosphatase PRUNE1 (Mus musculus) [Cotesia congregata]|uniref:Similar to Prune1: Exopolyphosphatase PRUNE1 (Mus musculus) n=1 Tax=Cotesia congregata TaxID=51543 RepID=A0A8J2H7Z0_COTCN|nr:Similar to Prune1: Exopolyphosphatase PRUNE1 (Mus musculus) [Cotesia congregata]